MSEPSLPIPNPIYLPFWRGARARCVKDDPPMHGFGRALKVGDVVEVNGVLLRDGGVLRAGERYRE